MNSELPDWENIPKVSDFKNDYLQAQSDHDTHIRNVDTWLDNLKITGNARIKKIKGKSSIVPKLIRKQAEWRYAALSEPFLSTEDIFNINPVSFEDKKAAEQNELVLNNQLNTKINKTKFIDELIRTTVDEGTVVVRIGWDFQEEIQKKLITEYIYLPHPNPQVGMETENKIHTMMQENPAEFEALPEPMRKAHEYFMAQQVPVIAQPVKTEMQDVLVTIKNEPDLQICEYQNLIIDPTAKGDISKAGFIIYSFETSLSELEKEGKYFDLDKINVDNNSILGDPDHYSSDNESTSFNFLDKPRKKFVAYEYWGFWDINNTGKVEPIIGTYVGDTLIRLEENPFPDKQLPFVLIQYLPVRKENYGQPDGELLEDNQKILGAVTRGMIDIMGRSANGQMASRKDALDVTNKRKFLRGEDYEFNTSIDPRQAFHMHTYPEIPNSAQFMIGLQNQEAESLTGVKAFTSGISGSSLGSTATGIRSALDATSKRELAILRRLAEGMKQIGRKIIAMNAEFLSETEVVRVTNDEFVKVRRDDLAGNFDLQLTISTAEADNDKAQELAFMLQTMASNQDPDTTRMIQAEIATLRKMPALAKKISEYQAPPPDPLLVKEQELKIALLEAQIETEKSQAVENYSNAKFDDARAISELADADKTKSETDQKNLDFLEQETGLSRQHELDMEKSKRNTQISVKAMDGINQAAKKDANN